MSLRLGIEAGYGIEDLMRKCAVGDIAHFYKKNGHNQNIGKPLSGTIVRLYTGLHAKQWVKLRIDARHTYHRPYDELLAIERMPHAD